MIMERNYPAINSIFGYVIDYNSEDVIYAELQDANNLNFLYYSPLTDNFYNQLDIFDNEQDAIEYYLGEIIKEKNESMLAFNALEIKITMRLLEHVK